jgi:hypothetical protein
MVSSKWKGGDSKHFQYDPDENGNDDESDTSFDLAQFGLTEADGEGVDLESSGSDGEVVDRASQVYAVDDGSQASLLSASEECFKVDKDEDEESREAEVGSVPTKPQAAQLAFEGNMSRLNMVDLEDLDESMQNSLHESIQNSIHDSIHNSIHDEEVKSDYSVHEQESEPDIKPALKPERCPMCSKDKINFKMIGYVLLALALVIGTILGSLGTTQDWFGGDDSSSSTKSNEEEPSSSPTAGPTTGVPVLRPTTSPTTSPTTLGPTLGPTSVPTVSPTRGPTTRPSTFRPTASPSDFVVPEGFLNLIVSAASFDGGVSVQSEGSPQNQAIKWLASSTGFDTLTDQQKIQRYALAAFYHSTAGDSWTNNEGWLSDESECNWFTRSLLRDICDSNGIFIGLELGFNNLGGVIPEEIGLLTSLTRISLGAGLRGEIRGTLPFQLGRLTLMQNFNVRDNELTGVIPPELGAWTGLDVFDLSRNRFSGPIPTTIGQMTNLTRLDLSRNELTGGVPNELATLELLETVRLEQNDLTGAVPRDVCTLFFSTAPLFYTDCGVPAGVDSEIGCFCCSHCCSDEQGCFSVTGT